MTKKLEGKVAVITGGTEGIGLATAKLFVNEGAYVFITGRRQKQLDEAVKAIGSNATGVQGDVAKMADLDLLYKTVGKVKGRVDIIFANAGRHSQTASFGGARTSKDQGGGSHTTRPHYSIRWTIMQRIPTCPGSSSGRKMFP